MKVLNVVASALASGHDVVDLEVADIEQHVAACAVSFLLPVEGVLVRTVVREPAQVSAPRDIVTVEIAETDYAFQPEDCGEWNKVEE